MIKKLLGQHIAAMRKNRSLTQEQFAEKTGYSVEFISLIERGINAPTIEGCEIIAKALNIPFKELFNFKETD